MALNKNEFLEKFNTEVKRNMSQLSQKEQRYIRDKGNKIIDLLLELENKNFLKDLSRSEAQEIQNKKLKNVILNHDHIKRLNQTFIKLVENIKQGSPKTEVKLKDKCGNEYKITMNQIVTFLAWTYCSLCEVMLQFLSSIIDFNKMNVRQPTGLGKLIYTLKYKQINVAFFEDIDTKVRNSFFHLDFRFSGKKVYCKHNPEIYKNKRLFPWRTQEDNNQSEYILLLDLLWLALYADRSTYATMHGVIYYLAKKSEPKFYIDF